MIRFPFPDLSESSLKNSKGLKLNDGATIAVIGGGPAGSFFALSMQRQMKLLGRHYNVVIIEKKKELGFYQDSFAMAYREGCNYCAGGISPRMSDVLKDLAMELPANVIQSKIRSITVHGHWKNIELKIPKNRQMLSVYRGARPVKRVDRHYGFDAFLLENAVKGGAELVTGTVFDINYSPAGNLQVHYKTFSDTRLLQADFVVFACGVNQVPGMKLAENKCVQTLQRLIKGFQPPPVRRTLIFELEGDPAALRNRTGDIYFIEAGSRKLNIDMCSIIPKEQFITVVLIGKSIDQAAGQSEVLSIVNQFLDLPHVKKILPKKISLACTCRPNMSIGAATQPYGDRVAIIGDMVTSRLYKDGILSAYRTASSLARAITETGIDRVSLEKAYEPAIRRFILDNRFGGLVFMLHGIMFSQPSLSRILYQAILTERKTKQQGQRILENILWKIASGDDRYQEIFREMIDPRTLWLIFTGGSLVTLRNYFMEMIFGVDWRGIGRFTTGVYKEKFDAKSKNFSSILSDLGITFSGKPEFERMYSIKIKANRSTIFQALGKFGDDDQQFFKYRMIRVKRVQGKPLQVGSAVRYETLHGLLNFDVAIKQIYDNEMIIFQVDSGFPKGGVLIFEIGSKGEQYSVLTIYVAFNFPEGKDVFSAGFWRLFKFFFPAYLHDVLWNNSLCKLKDIIETEED